MTTTKQANFDYGGSVTAAEPDVVTQWLYDDAIQSADAGDRYWFQASYPPWFSSHAYAILMAK